MLVYVLPVSGGGFVTQLAILQHLGTMHLTPDLVLASSGGNVAAYVAAAADWKWPGIERISREITHNLYVSPWSSVSAFSLIIGYFEGNVFNKGSGISDFLHTHFTPESIKKYEIWTGTYNKNKQRARLFCNRNRKHSIINTKNIDYSLTQSLTPVFCNGNIELISTVSVASASIPAVVPAQIIEDEYYIDGGIAGASPLTIMQEPLLSIVKSTKDPLHLVYINSVDLASPNIGTCHNVIDTWKQATHDLVRSQTVIDRLSGYEIIRCQPGFVHKEEFPCTYENLKLIKALYDKIQFSLLEIYPLDNYDINILKFTGNDVIDAMHRAYNNCACRFWWVSDNQDQCTIVDCEYCNIFTSNCTKTICRHLHKTKPNSSKIIVHNI